MPATGLGNNHITDIYMSALSSLRKEDKIILATKLLNSAAQTDKKKSKLDLRTCFKGDWFEGKTAKEAADELRKSRTFNRTVSTW